MLPVRPVRRLLDFRRGLQVKGGWCFMRVRGVGRMVFPVSLWSPGLENMAQLVVGTLSQAHLSKQTNASFEAFIFSLWRQLSNNTPFPTPCSSLSHPNSLSWKQRLSDNAGARSVRRARNSQVPARVHGIHQSKAQKPCGNISSLASRFCFWWFLLDPGLRPHMGMGENETTRIWTAGLSPWFHSPGSPKWVPILDPQPHVGHGSKPSWDPPFWGLGEFTTHFWTIFALSHLLAKDKYRLGRQIGVGGEGSPEPKGRAEEPQPTRKCMGKWICNREYFHLK